MKYQDAARKLKRLGCRELARKSGGSHRQWVNPVADRAAVLPDWGAKDLKIGTLHAAVKQLGLEWEDFEKA
jgi:mRNA interferase HicA